MILASLTTKFLFARLASLTTKLVCKPRNESCYKNSFCKTCKKRFSLRNFCQRNSREASLATDFDSQVLGESRENFGSKKRVSLLARISKSDSRVNPNHKADTAKVAFLFDKGNGVNKQTDVFSVWLCYYFYTMLSAGWCFYVFKAEFKDTTKVVLLTDKRMG
jgi:hypothetical protein